MQREENLLRRRRSRGSREGEGCQELVQGGAGANGMGDAGSAQLGMGPRSEKGEHRGGVTGSRACGKAGAVQL